MITDPRVFEDEHLPRELEHREGECRALSNALESALAAEERADDVLISGPSGVGKTVLARHTLSRLEDHADVHHAHIKCLGMSTGQILRTALDAHPRCSSVANNTPIDDVCERFQDVVTDPYVLILDEADDLPATDTLERVAQLPHVSVIAICHEPTRWLARIPESVRGSIATHIEPDRYHVDELTDILAARADQGLATGVVATDQLREIADEVAGVARHGIQSLRAAAELATERGHRTIADEDVADSFARAQHAIREASLKSLPFHHQVLYAILHGATGFCLEADALHERYDEVAEVLYHGRALSPIGARARRNKLSKLASYGLVDAEGPTRDRTYSVRDASIHPLVEIPRKYSSV